jgi:N-acetylglutamate synthase-like GNAT family acetyltransferase
MAAAPTSVREYRAGDLERCRELWRSLTQRHRDIYEDPSIGGPDPGLELDAHLQHPQLHAVWVATQAERVLGLCALLVQDEESELEPIVVDPRVRSRGIGALLAERAISESRRLGVKYVNVRPVARNLEAIRFFHRQGFSLLGRFELSIPLEAASAFGSSRSTEMHGLAFDY